MQYRDSTGQEWRILLCTTDHLISKGCQECWVEMDSKARPAHREKESLWLPWTQRCIKQKVYMDMYVANWSFFNLMSLKPGNLTQSLVLPNINVCYYKMYHYNYIWLLNILLLQKRVKDEEEEEETEREKMIIFKNIFQKRKQTGFWSLFQFVLLHK